MPPPPGYVLEFSDGFDGPDLDRTKWVPHYLPHWTTPELAATRYELRDGQLVLQITEADQPWCPDFDGATKASVLQTGEFAGPVGSAIGQLRFHDGLVVVRPQVNEQLYTPHHGYIEMRANASDDPDVMVALWMMGYEDEPQRSGEICVSEIFGREVSGSSARVGMGVHPFHDPAIVDEFAKVKVDVDVTEFHTYAVEWKPDHVEWFVDGQSVKQSDQAPDYPLQLMLGIYEFARDENLPPSDRPYPKEFVVDYVRGYRVPKT